MTCSLYNGSLVRLWAEGPDAVPVKISVLLLLHAEAVVQSHLDHLVVNCVYVTARLSSIMFKKEAC